MLFVEHSSASIHSRLNLELDSWSKWLVWIVVSLLIDHPSLVKLIVALGPVNVSLVGVRGSVNVEASVTDISDISDLSFVPSQLLEE